MKRSYYYPRVPGFNDFDRLFNLALPALGRHFGHTSTEGKPAADFYEDNDNYYVRVELPGVEKDAVNVAFDDGVIALNASRPEKKDKEEYRFDYKRSIRVPEGVNVKDISASHKDGVLTLTLPKAPQLKARQISVK